MNTDKAITVRLNARLAAQLRRIARQQHRSLKAQLDMVVQESLERDKKAV